MRQLLLFLIVGLTLFGSETPNFTHLDKTENAVFFLTTPKSGSNLISASLSIITRRPISWLYWKKQIFNPNSPPRDHPSYNRLGLDLVSEKPLLYRTHFELADLSKIRSESNKLILVTRNPKELLYRDLFNKSRNSINPTTQFIHNFIDQYLKPFKIYESWHLEKRFFVYYEDFIKNGDQILLEILSFMNEEPTFYEDFLINRQTYLSLLLESYKMQPTHNAGGSSVVNEPKAIFYTRNADPAVLHYIDEYIQNKEPVIWEKYLKRYQTSL